MGAARRLTTVVALIAVLGAVGCGSDDSGDNLATTDSTTTTVEVTTTDDTPATSAVPETTEVGMSPEDTLWILVSNDDGIGAPGIDVLVTALRELPNVEIRVVAPKDNQSGTGSKQTEGDVTVAEGTTLSGYHGTAVAGFPYDSVEYALDKGGIDHKPNVVITGINQGANVGPLVDISGTIGAARAAAQRGIPALATSQGLATEPDYDEGAKLVIEWVNEHRAELIAGTLPATVTSLNIPTCPSGSIRGVVTVPTAADAGGREVLVSNCEATTPAPVDDVDGFSNGYATFSTVPNTE